MRKSTTTFIVDKDNFCITAFESTMWTKICFELKASINRGRWIPIWIIYNSLVSSRFYAFAVSESVFVKSSLFWFENFSEFHKERSNLVGMSFFPPRGTARFCGDFKTVNKLSASQTDVKLNCINYEMMLLEKFVIKRRIK